MPSTIRELFAAAGLHPAGPVSWGTPVPATQTGVYLVALTDDADDHIAALAAAPISLTAIGALLKTRTELTVSAGRPTSDKLSARLASFWLPDEITLYVGLSGQPLGTRVQQYYNTPLGNCRPHAGGWWLKTLSVLPDLHVFWAATPHFEQAERRMLQTFARAVSPEGRNALPDTERVAPFANLRTYEGTIKRHGIRNATGNRTPSTVSGPAALTSDQRRSVHEPTGHATTQRVTSGDLAASRVRLTRASKVFLPSDGANVWVRLRGQDMRARWDPRLGPPERSGVLTFERGKLDGLVNPDEVLTIALSPEIIFLT